MQRAVLLSLLSSSWHPRKLFGSSGLGAVLVPSDWESLYQESNGLTAGAVGSPLGLVLDARYNPPRAGEILADPPFSNAAAWTAGVGWEVTGGKLVATSAGVGTYTMPVASPLTAGKFYEVEITCDSITGGSFTILQEGGDAYFADQTTAGTYRAILKAAATGKVYVWAKGTLSATFDNVSVKEVQGSHAIQATAGARPNLAAGGKVDYDGVDDSLVITFPSDMGSNCTVGRSVPNGEATILTGQTITTSYTDSTDHCGLVIINRALTATETLQLRRWLNRRAG